MQTALEQQLHDDVERILGSEGLLIEDGLTHNPKQYEYAKRCASGFCLYDNEGGRAALNMLEAATGTGKTLGYLVPLLCYAARTGERVMVSTFTRMLQKQILDKDALLTQKWVASVTGVTISIARRIGMSNYVSPVACAQMIDDLQRESPLQHHDAIDFLENLMDWTEEQNKDGSWTNSAVLDDFLAEIGLESLPDAIPLGRISVNRTTSPADEIARYEADIALAKQADVQVVNHALVMIHAYRWASVLDAAEDRQTTVLVCDEADRLADAAESIMQADLTVHHLNNVATRVEEILGTSNALKAVHELHDYIRHQVQIPERNVLAITNEGEHAQVLHDLLARAAVAVNPIAKKITTSHGDLHYSDKQHADLIEFVDAANDLALFSAAMAAADNTAVVSWSPVRSYPSMRIGRPNPGRILSRLWLNQSNSEDGLEYPPVSTLKAALFTSATLSVPGKTLPAAFDEFASSIGVIRHPAKGSTAPIHNALTQLYARFEPAQFGKLQFVLADPYVPNPTVHIEDEEMDRKIDTDKDWLDYVATTINTAYQQQSGRVLALTLSYRDTSNLVERLKGRIPEEDLIVHKPGQSLSFLKSQFTDSKKTNAVMLSPAAWEGLDMPGIIKHLVITRIPFLPLQSSESEILRAHLHSKGMAEDKISSALQARATSYARRKMAQGLGRPIRNKNDAATVWITDPRFPLPDRMTQSLDPYLLNAPSHRIQRKMLGCIAARFMDEYEENSKLCKLDGTVYQPLI